MEGAAVYILRAVGIPTGRTCSRVDLGPAASHCVVYSQCQHYGQGALMDDNTHVPSSLAPRHHPNITPMAPRQYLPCQNPSNRRLIRHPTP
jgi:hypothetical protein